MSEVYSGFLENAKYQPTLKTLEDMRPFSNYFSVFTLRALTQPTTEQGWWALIYNCSDFLTI